MYNQNIPFAPDHYIVGGSITSIGVADFNGTKPAPNTLASGASRVRDLNQRIAALGGVLDKVNEALFGPSPVLAGFAGSQQERGPSAPGQISELHEAIRSAEELVGSLESRISRLHNI